MPALRVLVVTNMYPGRSSPQRGRFVRDQVEALGAEEDLDLELFSFKPGSSAYPRATVRLRRLLRRRHFDLVHAHYGLTGWCALLAGARPLVVTFHGTDVRHSVVGPLSRRLAQRVDLVAAVSSTLFGEESGRPGLPREEGAAAVLPCGADLERFRPMDRRAARSELALDPDGRFLLFPADPARPEKRHDRAFEVAGLAGAELLTAGTIDPDWMPLWVNAASAVLAPSDREGFGLAAVEALACNIPILSTPVGIAPHLLAGVEGCLVAPFDASAWSAVARRHLDAGDARVNGAARAGLFSARTMAHRVALAYGDLLRPA